MNKVRALVDSAHSSIDRFAAQARDADGKELLRSHAKELPLVKRAAKSALILAHDIAPGAFDTILTKRYEKAGYQILGTGVQSTVLADGLFALKIFRHTAGLSEDQQQQLVHDLEDKQSVTLDHLADFAIPQSFAIDQDPADKSHAIVIARQRRIVGGHAINLRLPGARPQSLNSFIVGSQSMHDKIGGLPDIVGINNIFDENGTIKLVDTIPLLRSDPNDANALAQARSLLKIKPQ